MARWTYAGSDPGRLDNAADPDYPFAVDLQPGQEFEAPDGWLPEPNPHPVYKPVTPPAPQPAAPPAPEEQ